MESSPELRGGYRRRMYSSGSEHPDHFLTINERPVDDISIDLFYKPHTITLLLVTIIGLIYFCFTRDETASLHSNIQVGIEAAIFFFLIISVLAFPNGPFTRPHPAVWRCVFGLSVLYMLLLIFLLFQDYQTVRGIFEWFFPELKNFTIDMDKGEWGENCSDVSLPRLWNTIDFFCFAHFAGWAMKTLLVRHYGILWTISIMWEITEVCFCHLLPNFNECWWDSFILDVLLCNGLGIWFGMQFCHWMEMRYYSWDSMKDIRSTTGKLKRAVLQFTPESWTAMRWLHPTNTLMRTMAVCQLVIFWQLSELNTFFLKHIFQMPPDHPVVFIRILLLGAISAPSIRQYYSYVTDPRCKRVGTQAWVYGLCMSVEAIICIKFGWQELFQHTRLVNVLVWLVLMMLGAVLCVYLCVEHHKNCKRRKAVRERKERSLSPDCSSGGGAAPSSPQKSVTLSTPDSESDRVFADLLGDRSREALARGARRRERRGSSYSGVIGDDEYDEANDGDDSDSVSYSLPRRTRLSARH